MDKLHVYLEIQCIISFLYEENNKNILTCLCSKNANFLSIYYKSDHSHSCVNILNDYFSLSFREQAAF